jgi:hypothetical protein
MEEAVSVAHARSPLAVWLEENRTWFAALLARHGARWEALAAVLAEEGVTDVDGRPARAETLCGAWRRVLKRHARLASRSGRPTQEIARTTQPAPLPAPATPRPAPSATPLATENQPAESNDRADEQIARMERLFQARKGKMPNTL